MNTPKHIIEIWKSIADIPSHEVSNLGGVRHAKTKRHRTGVPDRAGYIRITFAREGKFICKSVHTLVCKAFNGPRPDKYAVNHIDGVKSNNVYTNLEWVTAKRNNAHAIELGLALKFIDRFPPPKGEATFCAKLTEQEVKQIRSFPKCWNNGAIAKLYGISTPNLCNIRNRKAWKHVQ